ncbi:hypothetical protein N7481_001202 [Penicillium waksmanii]|uniref:uncharacterized protein n=1 Tax=Penicillium waksmanii TaxID=69791 RepID=UPI002546C152|nr:uncharacterized protein N7481_001202 [Penicillium waksmanii]KAJ6000793.1 hypothetical protein N7481_001202 [Penicillium waksmanii]
MECRKDYTTTSAYYQKPRAASTESRASSPVGSQDTITVSGDDDPRSRPLVARADHDKFNTKTPSPSKYGGWASLDDTWLLECVAMAFSFASFIAVIVILRAYDHKPSPNLSYGLTLNSIISLLATASRSSLLFVVAGAVGQLKWIWFQHREQSVLDMQSFDDASRGPLGALYLLFQHRGLSVASLGAIVTVLSMALDPFVQQILSYPVQQTPGSTTQATMPQALTFASNANYTFLEQSYNAALWNTDFAVNPTCPSGNCTWPEFQSLGFCSKCQDVTDLATIYKCDQWTEPDVDDQQKLTDEQKFYGCSVNSGNGENGTAVVQYNTKTNGIGIPAELIWMVGLTKRVDSSLGVPYPVFVFAHAQFEAESANASFTNITEFVRGIRLKSVQECVLSLCLKTYNVSVSSGTPQVNVTSIDYGERFTNNLPVDNLEIEYGFQDIDCWRPTDRPGPFNFVKLPTGNWADTEQFVFCLRRISPNVTETGYIALDNLYANSPFLGYKTEQYMFNFSTALWAMSADKSWSTSAKFAAAFTRVIDYGLGSLLSDMAAALTKYTLQTSNASASGTAMTSQAFVKVSWQWLTFPSVLLVAGFAFWITTVMKNRQHRLGLWKSSILPMLYCGAEKIDPRLERFGSTADYTKISQMSQSAQITRVKMEDIVDGRLRLGRNKWSGPSVI